MSMLRLETFNNSFAGTKGELYACNRLQNVYLDSINNKIRYNYCPDPITENIECYYATGDIVTFTEEDELIYVGNVYVCQ